jgi:hypothetical protein
MVVMTIFFLPCSFPSHFISGVYHWSGLLEFFSVHTGQRAIPKKRLVSVLQHSREIHLEVIDLECIDTAGQGRK